MKRLKTHDSKLETSGVYKSVHLKYEVIKKNKNKKRTWKD